MIESIIERNLSLIFFTVSFMGNTHGNRILMGASMFRQSISILNFLSARAFSVEFLNVSKENGQNQHARWPGVVKIVAAKRLVIKSDVLIYSTIACHKILRLSSVNIEKERTRKSLVVFSFRNNFVQFCSFAYFFCSMSHTNQSTHLRQRSRVFEGDLIQMGGLLVDGRVSFFGCISSGRNLFLRYVPWEGLNFEDSLVINRQLEINETLTHANIEKWEVCLNDGNGIFGF